MKALVAASWLLLFSLALGCSTAAFQSQDVALEKGGEKLMIRHDTGAIIVGKRHVGDLRGHKILNSKGQPLAFVYDDYVRLKGGVQLALVTTDEGDLSISKSALEKAGLPPMATRVSADGRVSSTPGARGVGSKGTKSLAKRRLLLVVLLLTANDMW